MLKHRMHKTIIKEHTRGRADHGWLQSSHSFSFASYSNQQRMGFGALRVLNDDFIAGGSGFGAHPHNDMEIISIPLEGSLKHKDSLGSEHLISSGDIQIMSAGSGVVHSEYNGSASRPANFLQVWIKPSAKGLPPKYAQKNFKTNLFQNEIKLIVSPDGRHDSLPINQNAFLSLLDLEPNKTQSYSFFSELSGMYLFVISGKIQIDSAELYSRDAIEITECSNFEIVALEHSEALLIEVPLDRKGRTHE